MSWDSTEPKRGMNILWNQVGICRNPFKLDVAKSGQPYRKCPSECTMSAISWNVGVGFCEGEILTLA